jgi:hypothetical protein
VIPTAVTSSRAVSIGESFRLFAQSAKISITRRPMGGGALGRLHGWAPVRTDSPVEQGDSNRWSLSRAYRLISRDGERRQSIRWVLCGSAGYLGSKRDVRLVRPQLFVQIGMQAVIAHPRQQLAQFAYDPALTAIQEGDPLTKLMAMAFS